MSRGSAEIDKRAAKLIQGLVDKYDETYGLGCMSCTVYDTAWLAMISKKSDDGEEWLFPECFQYVLDTQLPHGGWCSYATEIDGILNTIAALLAMKLHSKVTIKRSQGQLTDLTCRIERAIQYLQNALDDWDVASTLHVGFEILVPSLLDLLKAEGITLEFPGYGLLYALRKTKMSKFHPSILYSDVSTTLLHSLEALIGLIDFGRVAHHKVNGSMMASPSSTAAYLMHTTTWDNEAEDYLRHVISEGEGRGGGGVPSALPSTHFEILWVLSTLLETGYTPENLGCHNVDILTTILEEALSKGRGLLGFAPGVAPDADDTSKAIKLLSMTGSSTSPKAMVDYFKANDHFRTYRSERNASFSANCNVLGCLLSADDPNMYTSQIEKATRFLCTSFWGADDRIIDKWNLSPQYTMMLFSQVMMQLLILWDRSILTSLDEKLVSSQIPMLLLQTLSRTLRLQNPGGSWGSPSSSEVTSYAILTLTKLLSLPLGDAIATVVEGCIDQGRNFLSRRVSGIDNHEYLWIEKVTYGSAALTEGYKLAALKATAPCHKFGDQVKAMFHFGPNFTDQTSTVFNSALLQNPQVWLVQSSRLESQLLAQHIEKGQSMDPCSTHMRDSRTLYPMAFLWVMASNNTKAFLSPKLLTTIISNSSLVHQIDSYLAHIDREDPSSKVIAIQKLLDSLFGDEDPAQEPRLNSNPASKPINGCNGSTATTAPQNSTLKRKADGNPDGVKEAGSSSPTSNKRHQSSHPSSNPAEHTDHIPYDSKVDSYNINGATHSVSTNGVLKPDILSTLRPFISTILSSPLIQNSDPHDHQRLQQSLKTYFTSHLTPSSNPPHLTQNTPNHAYIHLLSTMLTCLLPRSSSHSITETHLTSTFSNHLASYYSLKKSSPDHQEDLSMLIAYERKGIELALEGLDKCSCRKGVGMKVLRVFFGVVDGMVDGMVEGRM